jgi:hypothetical protein
VNRRLAVAFVTLLLAGALPALAFVRTTVNGDGSGPDLRWGTFNVPYVVNNLTTNGTAVAATDVCGSPTDLNAVIDAIQKSFDAWNNAVVSPGMQLTLQGTTKSTQTGYNPSASDNENLIIFRGGSCDSIVPSGDSCGPPSPACADKYNCWNYAGSLIALTTVSFDTGNGLIVDADTELNAWDGTTTSFSSDGAYFTCIDPTSGSPPANACAMPGATNCSYVDVENTVTHEAGHFIGMAHPCYLSGMNTFGAPSCSDPIAQTPVYQDATMYPTAPPWEIQKRKLSPDDVDGLKAIIADVASTPPSSVTGNGGKGCGCDQGLAGPGALVLLAGLGRRRGSTRRSF